MQHDLPLHITLAVDALRSRLPQELAKGEAVSSITAQSCPCELAEKE